MEGEDNELFMSLLVKLGPGDLNRQDEPRIQGEPRIQDEPRIQGESWKRIENPCAAAASIRK